MARNIEIKARVGSLETLRRIVAPLATSGPTTLDQDDTFFRCSNGRLKLRAFSATVGELIYYRRAEEAGPKISFYVRSPTSAPDTLRESLTLAYGQSGRVRKRRELYLIGRTRVHLDRVEGLGEYLELEVVLRDDERPEAGIAEADRLIGILGVDRGHLLTGSYVDMMAGTAECDGREPLQFDGPRATIVDE